MKTRFGTVCNKDVGASRIHIEDGVFSELVDNCTFVDQIRTGLWGCRRSLPTGATTILRNTPIGGKQSHYCRAIQGHCSATGNPLTFKYGKKGKIAKFTTVAPSQLVMRSLKRPLSGAELESVQRSLFCHGSRAQIGMIELTFDLTGTSVEEIADCCFPRVVQSSRFTSITRKRTFYLGSVTSIWQARTYEKTSTVTRIEFILRSGFLRQHQISDLSDLLKLKNIPLIEMLGLRTFTHASLRPLLRATRPHWKRRILVHLSRNPVAFVTLMKADDGVDVSPLLREHPLAARMKRMLQMLSW